MGRRGNGEAWPSRKVHPHPRVQSQSQHPRSSKGVGHADIDRVAKQRPTPTSAWSAVLCRAPSAGLGNTAVKLARDMFNGQTGQGGPVARRTSPPRGRGAAPGSQQKPNDFMTVENQAGRALGHKYGPRHRQFDHPAHLGRPGSEPGALRGQGAVGTGNCGLPGGQLSCSAAGGLRRRRKSTGF